MTEIERYIRTAAIARGIDPDVAVRIAMTEGGVTDPVRQSNIIGPGGREQSYGPYQMNVTGGLGAEALKMHIDPRNPNQWKQTIDFALDVAAKKKSWADWHGARDNNIPNDAGFSETTKPIGVTLTSLRHVGGAGSGDANFADPNVVPVPDSAYTSSVASSDQPAPPAKTESEGWADKLAKLAEGDDAKAALAGLTGQSTESSGGGDGLYKGDQQLTSILPSLEAGDMARMQSAQALMAQLMASKKRPRGLTLTGVPNAV
jgi:hypothetical protein